MRPGLPAFQRHGGAVLFRVVGARCRAEVTLRAENEQQQTCQEYAEVNKLLMYVALV